MTHKVRVGMTYIYYPNLLDRIDGRTNLVPGDVVTVINKYGCPKANTMGHCYVTRTGSDFGLVSTNSLYSFKDKQMVIDALKADVEKAAR